MHQKKILVISSGFYPQISPRSFRTTELVKELSRQGHKLTVITHRIANVHDEFEKKHGVEIKDLGKLRFPQINLSQKKGFLSLISRMVRRGLLLLFEYPEVELMFLVKKALKSEKGYDQLISIAVPYPIHWGVAKALPVNKMLTKIWVADCGDPFMGAQTDSFKKPFYFKYVEKWFCKKVDFITVPTEGSISAYYPEFRDKIKVIPQGFNFEETTIEKNPPNNAVPHFGYAGMFIPGRRDPSQLLDFLCKYEHPFKFIIYTNTPTLVLPYITASNNRIELRPYIPRDRLLYELSKMDFLININNGTSVQTPSKIIDYALTRRPILSMDTSMSNHTTIQEFLAGNYQGKLDTGNIEKYNIKNVAGQFLDLSEPADEKNKSVGMPAYVD
jgi:hypothetical protein